LALACLVVFDEVIIPAADFGFESAISSADYQKIRIPDVELSADWQPVHESKRLLQGITSDLLHDVQIAKILSRVPQNIQREVLADALSDILLMKEYQAPLVSSYGRRVLIHRLLQLGVSSLSVPANGDNIA